MYFYIRSASKSETLIIISIAHGEKYLKISKEIEFCITISWRLKKAAKICAEEFSEAKSGIFLGPFQLECGQAVIARRGKRAAALSSCGSLNFSFIVGEAFLHGGGGRALHF